jgi:hypothetical protein
MDATDDLLIRRNREFKETLRDVKAIASRLSGRLCDCLDERRFLQLDIDQAVIDLSLLRDAQKRCQALDVQIAEIKRSI